MAKIDEQSSGKKEGEIRYLTPLNIDTNTKKKYCRSRIMIRKIERIETIGVLLGDNLVDVSVRIWEPKDSKSAIICIHGFGGTSEDFAPLAETLVKVGITVIAPDMFGRGLSSFFGIPDAYNLRIQLTAIATILYDLESLPINEKGFAIVLALVLLLVMSLMGGTLIVMSSSDHQNNNLNRRHLI